MMIMIVLSQKELTMIDNGLVYHLTFFFTRTKILLKLTLL